MSTASYSPFATIGAAPGIEPITVTFFRDEFAKTKTQERITIDRLAQRISKTSRQTKAGLPWLKFARFGDRRSEKKSLRHDGNIEAITGIEGDYDCKLVNGRVISFEEAIARVRNAGIAAILYTSPSFSEDTQKYRVIARLSVEFPPTDRDRFMARLNGLFDGGFDPASWAWSQAYYFGAVAQNPSHRVEVIDGICIDQATHLDATAIGRPEKKPKPNGANGQYHAARPEDISDKRVRGLIAKLLAAVSQAPKGQRHDTLLRQGRTLGGYLHLIGWSPEQACEALVHALPLEDQDDGARKTAADAVRYGMDEPLDLAERPNPRSKREPPPEPEPEPSTPDDDPSCNEQYNFPTIVVMAGHRHDAADAGLAAMQAAGVEFYIRDKSLVRVCRVKAKAANNSLTTTPAVVAVTIPNLARALGKSAVWNKLNAKGEPHRTDPPKDVVEQIAAMVGEWPFPPLAGIINTPTMRPDGSLLVKPGYDPATGYFLFDPPAMPRIPDRPSRDDALASLKQLTDLLVGFPFVDAASRSVAISMIMTPVLRCALGAVPMHTVSAPMSGTGKSHLANTASAIATGDKCAVIAMSSPDETEKRLVAAAMSQHPIIAIDNVSDLLMGDLLCQLTEQEILRLRPLGTSDDIRAANSFTVFANGNNLTVGADNVRRTIQASLDAHEENPEVREFEFDPVGVVLADRGKTVAAVLTIARAYVTCGKPQCLAETPSYAAWSNLVRSPLVWLGMVDPIDTIANLRSSDPVRQERAAVFSAWAGELQLDVGYLVPELAQTAEQFTMDQRANPELWEAFSAIAIAKGGQHKIDTRRLGRWLARNINNIAAGYRLSVDNADAARPRYRICNAQTKTQGT